MTPRLAHRFPAAWLCELAPLRQAFDDWWDKAGIDALARPPMVVGSYAGRTRISTRRRCAWRSPPWRTSRSGVPRDVRPVCA